MDKLLQADENGVIIAKCKTHYYSDLPNNGLFKSYDSVGLDEPILIKQSELLMFWDVGRIGLNRRAHDLNAEVKIRELPLLDLYAEYKYQLWFSLIEGNSLLFPFFWF